jgi:uncharacterized protein (DUF924 family)
MPKLPDSAGTVLDYWTDIGPQGWYTGGDDLDTEIRNRFLDDWEVAASGGYRNWLFCARGMLAYLILTDQFPRNMFRGDPRSFATDAMAREAAMRAWKHGLDMEIDPPLRQFFYLPFMHAETSIDQSRSVCLMKARMPQGNDNLLHAQVHREIIRRFGRFPYRNEALGRRSTAEEIAFLDGGGYRGIMEDMQA